MTKRLAALAALLLTILGAPALAGEPQPWQIGFQEAASPTMVAITDFHTMLLWLISAISLFVLALLLWVVYRYRESRNPTPSRTTHNTVIEVAWTVVPVIILVLVFIPSYRLMVNADRVADADMTLKVIGHQWYWSYEYPDHGNFTFDANIVAEEDLEDKSKRLLETDNRVVLPVGKKIRLLLTAGDVLHSWGVPSLGIKLDTVPGRLNETWVEITREGVYYGFCSELCGVNHSYMPIAIEAVSEDDFNAWVEKAQQEFARVDGPEASSVRMAQTAPVE
ncbi:MAG: cytochrome c oxidase subunit II [Alphaproteobacteria bacterium]|nr:cytochrome c oxidase subunit II [Alphaproteobacteria bacterium]